MFLAIISYVLGMSLSTIIPRHGLFRYLNPVCQPVALSPGYALICWPSKHPFNKKENAFVVIMASAAANSALGTEVLAVQRLFYNITPNPGASVL